MISNQDRERDRTILIKLEHERAERAESRAIKAETKLAIAECERGEAESELATQESKLALREVQLAEAKEALREPSAGLHDQFAGGMMPFDAAYQRALNDAKTPAEAQRVGAYALLDAFAAAILARLEGEADDL